MGSGSIEIVHARARGLIPFFMRSERELPFKSKLTQELQVFLKWSRDCVGCSDPAQTVDGVPFDPEPAVNGTRVPPEVALVDRKSRTQAAPVHFRARSG